MRELGEKAEAHGRWDEVIKYYMAAIIGVDEILKILSRNAYDDRRYFKEQRELYIDKILRAKKLLT